MNTSTTTTPSNQSPHPLSTIFPARSLEELRSIENCEGLVEFTGEEELALLASPWFRRKTVTQRMVILATHHDWLAPGSNQYVKRLNPRSPRAAARAAQQAITKAAHHA